MTAIRFEDAQGDLAEVKRASARRSASAAAGRLLAMLREWRRRACARADLVALDDRMLADIGITRADAEYLGNRPFWRA